MALIRPTAPKVRNLANAPIVEAILDFRFGNVANTDINALIEATAPFAENLPNLEIQQQLGEKDQAVFSFIEPQSNKSEIVRTNKTGSEVANLSVTVRLDGFVVRQGRPYTQWKDLYKAAEVLFEGYVRIAKPQSVVRIATRYINQIIFPKAPFELDEYFVYGPQVPADVSNNVFAFQSRIGVRHASNPNIRGWFQQYLSFLEEDSPSMIMDIDVFSSGPFLPHWANLENQLEELHVMKNGLFFGSLTEAAVKEYE